MRRRGECELNQRGLTLIELMVALAIGFIVIAAVYQAFTSQQRTYTIQDQVAEAQQSARAAMNILMRDLRMAGFGRPEGDVDIGDETYRYSIGVENDPENDGSYIITLVGCFGTPKGYLTETADKDDSEISVRSTGNELSEIFTNSNHIFIGGMEKLRVADAPDSKEGTLTLNSPLVKRYPTGVLSVLIGNGATQIPLRSTAGLRAGDVLFLGQDRLVVMDVGTDTITIDTDPDTAGNQGISGSYPAGTFVNPVPIYRLTALAYYIESDPRSGYLVLRRHDMVEGNRTLAENIQELGVEPADNDQSLYDLWLTARTRVEDPDYIHPITGDHYRTRQLKSRVMLRNL